MNVVKKEVLMSSEVVNRSLTSDYYLGCGRILSLEERENIFLPSKAGIFFWETLYSNYFFNKPRDIKILELGTGSGFFSFALAAHGFTNITATDINAEQIEYAKQMWEQSKNKNEASSIDFRVSNLFENINEDDFDVIVFNAPGWGTPSNNNLDDLKHISGSQYYSMFEGDQIVSRSIDQALSKLKLNGSYFIGLNSISGIFRTISNGFNEIDENKYIARSLALTELPLLLYNKNWLDNKKLLLEQFEKWKTDQGGFYKVSESDGSITWVYDVIELTKTSI